MFCSDKAFNSSSVLEKPVLKRRISWPAASRACFWAFMADTTPPVISK